jgi:hypothetical protein
MSSNKYCITELCTVILNGPICNKNCTNHVVDKGLINLNNLHNMQKLYLSLSIKECKNGEKCYYYRNDTSCPFKHEIKETREYIKETREDIKEYIKETREDIKEDIKETREDIKEDIKETREDIKITTKLCRFGMGCRNKDTDCTFKHVSNKPCNYGDGCRNKETCIFKH